MYYDSIWFQLEETVLANICGSWIFPSLFLLHSASDPGVEEWICNYGIRVNFIYVGQ